MMMKTMKLLSGLAISSTLLLGSNYETNVFYKHERHMAMGGTGVSYGGKAPSVFYNPAGLTKMDAEGGIDFELLGLNVGAGAGNLLDEYLAGNLETEALLDPMNNLPTVITTALGENINVNTNFYDYLSAKFGIVTASLGAVASNNTNLQLHSGFGPAGLLEVSSTTYTGVVATTSFSVASSLHLGVGFKYIGAYAVSKSLGLGDLGLDLTALLNGTGGTPDTDALTTTLMSDLGIDNLPTSLLDQIGYGMALDVGAIYDLDNLRRVSSSRLLNNLLDITNPSMGVSVLNLGGYLDASHAAHIPQTINVGLTARPYCAWFRELIISAELHDILGGYEINASRGLYGMFRAGFEGYLIKNILMDLAFRGGWLNGSWSAGTNLRLAMFHLGVATYVEELGGYIGQAQNRRYMLNLGLRF
jgi:hypothetical protein